MRNKLVGQLIRAVGMRNILIYFSNRPSRFRAGPDGATESQNRAKGKSESAFFRLRQGCIKLLEVSLSSIGWRRGLGRGAAFLLVSPLLGPLPTRSSRGEDGELDAALRDSRTFTSTPSLPKCLGSSLYRY